MRRLVRLDPTTLNSIDIDRRRLTRIARELKRALTYAPTDDVDETIRAKILKCCEAALNDKLALPLKPADQPLNLGGPCEEKRQPAVHLMELYTAFIRTATGAHVEREEPMRKDGQLLGWMEFE